MTEITLLGKSVQTQYNTLQNLIQYDICSIVRSAVFARKKIYEIRVTVNESNE